MTSFHLILETTWGIFIVLREGRTVKNLLI